MIQVIHRAINILEEIANYPNEELGLAEIADAVELNHGTCANILKTLISRGYVEQSVAKKGYKLGYMAYQLVKTESYEASLVNLARIPMEELNKQINEAIILSVINNYKRILLNEIPCTNEIQVRTTKESSVYRATTGRLILSYYSPKELDDFISVVGLPEKTDWPEVNTKAELIHQLNDIRKNNQLIYLNRNHVVGLAVPIIKKNKVIASLGIYIPDMRFGNDQRRKYVKLLNDTAEQINKKIATN